MFASTVSAFEQISLAACQSPCRLFSAALLESTLASELAARKFSYTRTDGSQWTLALKDVLDRTSALEMAYNLNDCVELR